MSRFVIFFLSSVNCKQFHVCDKYKSTTFVALSGSQQGQPGRRIPGACCRVNCCNIEDVVEVIVPCCCCKIRTAEACCRLRVVELTNDTGVWGCCCCRFTCSSLPLLAGIIVACTYVIF
jgi:hypothetical protein